MVDRMHDDPARLQQQAAGNIVEYFTRTSADITVEVGITFEPKMAHMAEQEVKAMLLMMTPSILKHMKAIADTQ